MATLKQISDFLDKELKIKSIPDSSRNGLQVISSIKDLKKEVKRVGFAVDACLTTFEKAKKAKVDLLIVHHGLLWRKRKKDHGLLKRRISFLMRNQIALYASHLPVDKNEKYGNNIVLFKMLEKIGLQSKSLKKFGIYKSQSIGYMGRFKRPVKPAFLARTLNACLKTKCRTACKDLSARKNIQTIGIISGRGSSLLDQVEKKNLDCYFTGEICHEDVCEARDRNILIITAGHYATETVGVKALMPLLKQKFNIEPIFIEDNTNL